MDLLEQIQQHARFMSLVERMMGIEDNRPIVKTVPRGTYNA